MAHKYKSIFGWTDFESIYEMAVNSYNNTQFIEIGNFQGRSAALLGELIKEKQKNIQVICVDIFPTTFELDKWKSVGASQGDEGRLIRELNDSLINIFVKNMYDAGVDDIVIPIKSTSEKAWHVLNGKTYGMVFIDGGHGRDACYRDIELYYPLVSNGGICAGHDFGDLSVNQAVYDYFRPLNINVEHIGNSWLVKKKDK